jgi:hypothetical protein
MDCLSLLRQRGRAKERKMWQEELDELMKKGYSKEQDVREEFITPLLKILGYTSEEIKRARPLKTPAMEGSKKKGFIVPDYIIILNGKPMFVIDAKKTKIEKGKSARIKIWRRRWTLQSKVC